ncbi:unnamed protein product, partial [Prorocentrum cordatum]
EGTPTRASRPGSGCAARPRRAVAAAAASGPGSVDVERAAPVGQPRPREVEARASRREATWRIFPAPAVQCWCRLSLFLLPPPSSSGACPLANAPMSSAACPRLLRRRQERRGGSRARAPRGTRPARSGRGRGRPTNVRDGVFER